MTVTAGWRNGKGRRLSGVMLLVLAGGRDEKHLSFDDKKWNRTNITLRPNAMAIKTNDLREE